MQDTAGYYGLNLIDKLAMARVEPFGLHLFEFILYLFVGFLLILAFSTLINAIKLHATPSAGEIAEIMEMIETVEVRCASCEWSGRVGTFHKACPKCGSRKFAL